MAKRQQIDRPYKAEISDEPNSHYGKIQASHCGKLVEPKMFYPSSSFKSNSTKYQENV